ncbi:MAG: putative signal peptide peptidase SppA [Phycisphaerae bacterium]|nr:putative signal peptide peptidase SppA [Phycisphaerae bacterium]
MNPGHSRRFAPALLAALTIALPLLAAGGCTPARGGILLTAVSADRHLTETVLARDPGLFVSDRVVVIDVDGMLINSEVGGFMSAKENPVAAFIEKLDKAADDSRVKAVILRINSPGGTVAASDVMHHELLRFRSKRPDVRVVAAIEDMGASGAYYLACAAEKIYMLPSGIAGSIGVIFQTFSFAGSLKMLGIKAEAIKSGTNKDMASPLHDLSERERALLQQIIDAYYSQFLQAVLDGRPGLTREKLLPLADGRIYVGAEAKAVGLVDDLLYREQVLARVKKDAGLGRTILVTYGRPMDYKANYYSQSNLPAPQAGPTINLVNIDMARLFTRGQPQFLYLYTGE